MKALTVWQPYASLLTWTPDGRRPLKECECRDWPPPRALLGGDVAIHAAKRRIRPEEWVELEKRLGPRLFRGLAQHYGCRGFLPCGAVVGIGRGLAAWQVVYVGGPRWPTDVKARSLADGRMRFLSPDGWGDWSPGVWLWTWDRVDEIDPAPAVGRQGLWDWEPPAGDHATSGRVPGGA